MIDDRQLDQLLNDAARSYRVPPAAPLDSMWAGIEREAFAESARPHRAVRWTLLSAAAAAVLLLGVAVGRYTAPIDRPHEASIATSPMTGANDPYQRTTVELLGRTAVLLTGLRTPSASKPNAELSAQAGQLLTTTRRLLDSPVGTDPRMRDLLQDLELVLAQVARLQSPRQRADIALITNALEERDLVPRVRSAVADLATNEY